MGLINVKAAADLVQAYRNSPGTRRVIEYQITTTVTARSYSFTWDGSSPIRVHALLDGSRRCPAIGERLAHGGAREQSRSENQRPDRHAAPAVCDAIRRSVLFRGRPFRDVPAVFVLHGEAVVDDFGHAPARPPLSPAPIPALAVSGAAGAKAISLRSVRSNHETVRGCGVFMAEAEREES